MVTIITMKLDEYLTQNGLTPQKFGELLGEKPPITVYRYLNGDRIPNKETMCKIATITGYQVMPNDFYDVECNPQNKTLHN